MPTANYLWNPINDSVIAEFDDAGNTIAEYTTEPDGRLISEYRDGVTYQHHYDAQGNTRALTNDQGEVTDTFAYTSNGELTERTGTTPTPFQFGGEHGYYTDETTGQIMARGRDYDPARARWLSVAPLPPDGEPDVLYDDNWLGRRLTTLRQRYGYRGNNPLRNDPPRIARRRRQFPGLLANLLFAAVVKAKFPKSATSTLDCPGYGCQAGQCSFTLSMDARVFPDGSVVPGARICFQQTPGEYIPPAPRDPTLCQSEINRSVKLSDHMTVVLTDGTVCKFTEPDFPRDRPWPPLPGKVKRECEEILRVVELDPGHPPEGPLKGACYETTDFVKSISVDMTMEVGCYCTTCKGFANYDTLQFKASTE